MAASITIPTPKPSSVTARSGNKLSYTTVSSKGQVVIPAAIRQELGIEPGTQVAIRV